MKISPLEAWISRKIDCSPDLLSRQRIRDYQLQMVNSTLQLVRKKSQFYRAKLMDHPAKVNSLEEFSDFPFTTAEDLQNGPGKFLCVSQNDVSRIVTLNTTGTTGSPKRCFFTLEDQELTRDFFGVGMSTLVEAGDRVLILLPGESPGSVGDLLQEGLARIDVTGIKHGPVMDLDETLARIIKLNINCLVGVPSQVMALAQFSKIHRSKYPVNMKSILLSTDYVPQAIVESIIKNWDCDVFNHYGMTEMGLGGGVFCSAQTGYHLREADLYFEIIDPVSGQILADEEEGEVVFTTLTRLGMPLVRYRTGDLSRFLVEKCPCGTTLKTLERIRGRVSQIVNIGSNFFRIGDFDEVLYQVDGLLNYQMEIQRSTQRDKLYFNLFSISKEPKMKDDILQALHSLLKNAKNVEITIKIQRGYPPELGSMQKKQIIENSIEID